MNLLLIILGLALTTLAVVMPMFIPDALYHYLFWAFSGGAGITAGIVRMREGL